MRMNGVPTVRITDFTGNDACDDFTPSGFKKVKYKCELAFCVRFEDIAEFKYAWKSCPLAERTRFLKDRQAKIKARVKVCLVLYYLLWLYLYVTAISTLSFATSGSPIGPKMWRTSKR